MAVALDETFVLELAQRLAHRGAAHAQLPRELGVLQHLERPQRQIEDQPLELPVDDLARRLAIEAGHAGR